MEKYKRGTVVYFKVGNQPLGVVIGIMEDKVQVRTPTYEIRDYFPEELLTDTEYVNKQEAFYNSLPRQEAIDY